MIQSRSQIFLWERSVLFGVDGKRKRIHFGIEGIVRGILLPMWASEFCVTELRRTFSTRERFYIFSGDGKIPCRQELWPFFVECVASEIFIAQPWTQLFDETFWRARHRNLIATVGSGQSKSQPFFCRAWAWFIFDSNWSKLMKPWLSAEMMIYRATKMIQWL